MIARTAAPPNVSGFSGPRTLVTKVWTTRWWLVNQRSRPVRASSRNAGTNRAAEAPRAPGLRSRGRWAVRVLRAADGQGCRGAAGPRLARAGDLGRPAYPVAEVAGGGHGDRHDPDLVAELAAGGRPPRGHRDRDGDLAELLAARGQQGSQRPGDRGEHHVVDGAAVGVCLVPAQAAAPGIDGEFPRSRCRCR